MVILFKRAALQTLCFVHTSKQVLVADEHQKDLLDSLEKIEQRLNYIHYNPIEAEIVYNERDYVNSSYRNYEEDNTVFCNVNVKPLW